MPCSTTAAAWLFPFSGLPLPGAWPFPGPTA